MLTSRPVVRRLLLLLLAAHAVVAVVLLWQNARWKLHEARVCLFDDESAARHRLYGDDYATVVERAMDAIPRTGAYRIVDASGDVGDGVFLRWEMAPRRAILSSDPRGPSAAPPAEVAAAADVTLVALPEKPPRVIHQALRDGGRPPGLPGREDESIPAAVDGPVPGAPATPDLVVHGWCQERGSRPCEALRFFVDGEELVPRDVERLGRPDVERAVPGIGDASRAGFRARLALPQSKLPVRQLSVLLVAADGRWRLLGPVDLKGEP